MDKFKFLNPDDFKRWISRQEDSESEPIPNGIVGSFVEAKHCGKKTARCITVESGRAGRIVREFIQSGGIVKEVDGDECLVEVSSGSFYIKRRDIIF